MPNEIYKDLKDNEYIITYVDWSGYPLNIRAADYLEELKKCRFIKLEGIHTVKEVEEQLFDLGLKIVKA